MRFRVFHHLVNGLQPIKIHPLACKINYLVYQHLDYKILKSELSICLLPADWPIPQAGRGFFSATRTSAELSVVCENAPPDSSKVDSGWTALQIVGPLAFALTGILASFATPLAEAGISIFSISTFDTG